MELEFWQAVLAVLRELVARGEQEMPGSGDGGPPMLLRELCAEKHSIEQVVLVKVEEARRLAEPADE
jgi:hypothetical protein